MNKRAILFIIKLILIFAIFTLIAILLINVSRHSIVSETSSEQNSSPVIIIDPGHGGIDGGATGINGCIEKELNLSIALKLYDMLNNENIPCDITRSSDILLCADAPSGKKKLTDLQSRLDIQNKYQNGIMLSIHMNTYQSQKYSGAQVYYSPNSEDSSVFAEIIQNRIKNNLQPENNRLPKAATSSIYLLHNATKPSVLVECGFISNPDEADKLCTDEYQTEIAKELFLSITEYLGFKNERN